MRPGLTRLVVSALLGLSLFVGAPADRADAGRLKSVNVTESVRLPKAQPGWPVPHEPNQLFYVQRSSNSNTVVYTVRLDSAGKIDAGRPVEVFWRRYNTTGERKALKRIERQFAYGVSTRARSTPGEFTVTLKPLPEIPMLLRQMGNAKPELFAKIGGHVARPVYAYVQVDEGSLIPRVTGLTLYGFDFRTGKAISETFSVSGGAINQ